MDNYLNEICDICKLPFNEIINDYKVTQIGNKAIVVYNFIKILDYSDEKISLKVKGDIFTIIGVNLYISQINKNEIIIKGKICSCGIEVKENDK